MTHEKKAQSTGSWKGNRDQHQAGPQKGIHEKKREADSWVQKGEKKKKEESKRDGK